MLGVDSAFTTLKVVLFDIGTPGISTPYLGTEVEYPGNCTSRRSTNYLKPTLAKRATIGPQKETVMMTPAALNAGDRIFWVG
jgi:hypothetical protein